MTCKKIDGNKCKEAIEKCLDKCEHHVLGYHKYLHWLEKWRRRL